MNTETSVKKDNLIHLSSDMASTYVQATVFFSEPDSNQREDMQIGKIEMGKNECAYPSD